MAAAAALLLSCRQSAGLQGAKGIHSTNQPLHIRQMWPKNTRHRSRRRYHLVLQARPFKQCDGCSSRGLTWGSPEWPRTHTSAGLHTRPPGAHLQMSSLCRSCAGGSSAGAGQSTGLVTSMHQGGLLKGRAALQGPPLTTTQGTYRCAGRREPVCSPAASSSASPRFPASQQQAIKSAGAGCPSAPSQAHKAAAEAAPVMQPLLAGDIEQDVRALAIQNNSSIRM